MSSQAPLTDDHNLAFEDFEDFEDLMGMFGSDNSAESPSTDPEESHIGSATAAQCANGLLPSPSLVSVWALVHTLCG